MYLKSILIFSWAISSYSFLVFGALPLWGIFLSAVSLSLSLTALSFNVMHDGLHGAYSNRQAVNTIMGVCLDAIGGSSYYWYWKHNYLHHTYPNVTGHDDDISIGILARFSPHQKKYYFHRLQHAYIWLLYGFLAIKWHFYDDFYSFFTKSLGHHPVDRPKGWDLLVFIGGKITFFTLAFIIPAIFYPIMGILLFYILIAVLQGLIMSIVFQLAHCNQEADFPLVEGDPLRINPTWFVHQLETTTDFGRNNKFLCWYVGGLNFQVEHHLFPKLCHINYPAISSIVEKTCREYNITYLAYGSFLSAMRSHYKWLHQLGQA